MDVFVVDFPEKRVQLLLVAPVAVNNQQHDDQDDDYAAGDAGRDLFRVGCIKVKMGKSKKR